MDQITDSIKKYILPLLALGGLGYLAETGSDGGFIKDVWAMAKTAGPFGAALALMAWLDERKERRDAQRQCNERTIDFVNSTNRAVRAFESLGNSLRARRGKGGAK